MTARPALFRNAALQQPGFLPFLSARLLGLFAQQMQALPHGRQVLLQRAAGMVHGFARMLTASPAARQHVEAACQLLSRCAKTSS